MDFETTEEMTEHENENVEAADSDEESEINFVNEVSTLTVQDLSISSYVEQGMMVSSVAMMISIGVAWIIKMFPWSKSNV